MSWYTKFLSFLGEKEADRIDMECRKNAEISRVKVEKLLKEKAYLMSIISENVQDIADIKHQLEEVNKKLAEMITENKKTKVELVKFRSVENDLTLIIEAFLEKYPDAKLSEMVRKKNENENPN